MTAKRARTDASGFKRKRSTRKPAYKSRKVRSFYRPRRNYRRAPFRMFRRRYQMRRMPLNGISARAFFDASRYHGNPHLGVPDQLADYTAIRGVVRTTITSPDVTGATALFVFTWTPSVARCFKITNISESGSDPLKRVEFPIQAAHTRASGPSMIRPLRQSVVIRNTSAAQDVQGYIRVLHINQPIYLSFVKNNGGTEGPPDTRYAKASVTSIEHAQLVQFVNQHPRTRTVTNSEMRTGITIPILPGAMSQYKEYHPWSDYVPNHTWWDMADEEGNQSSEQYLASLTYKYAQSTPMSTLILSVPTSDANHRMSFDLVYHYQDAVRAADPESITAQFARPGRPMNTSAFNKVMAHANRTGSHIPLVPDASEVPETRLSNVVNPGRHIDTLRSMYGSWPMHRGGGRLSQMPYPPPVNSRLGNIQSLYEQVDWSRPMPPFLMNLAPTLMDASETLPVATVQQPDVWTPFDDWPSTQLANAALDAAEGYQETQLDEDAAMMQAMRQAEEQVRPQHARRPLQYLPAPTQIEEAPVTQLDPLEDEDFLEQLVAVAGPSPTPDVQVEIAQNQAPDHYGYAVIAQTQEPDYPPGYATNAHGSAPVDANERRTLKFANEYRDWLTYGGQKDRGLAAQLGHVRRIQDYDFSASRDLNLVPENQILSIEDASTNLIDVTGGQVDPPNVFVRDRRILNLNVKRPPLRIARQGPLRIASRVPSNRPRRLPPTVPDIDSSYSGPSASAKSIRYGRRSQRSSSLSSVRSLLSQTERGRNDPLAALGRNAMRHMRQRIWRPKPGAKPKYQQRRLSEVMRPPRIPRVVAMPAADFDVSSPLGPGVGSDIIVTNQRTGSQTRYLRQSSFRGDFENPVLDIDSSFSSTY